MTQNLALDLSVDTPLTPEDSDVTSSWTPGYDTQTDAKIGTGGALSWNLGEYVLSTPTTGDICTDGTVFELPVSTFANCVGGGFVDVSAMSAMTEISTNGVILDDNKYDAHYLVGNYYNWDAATAGTGNAIIDEDAIASVCPNGWHLPIGRDQGSGSFYYLLNQYGLSSNPGSGSDNIALAPLYLLRGGFVQVTDLSTSPQPRAPDINQEPGLRNAGAVGIYATSSAPSTQYEIYSLYFDTSAVYPNHTGYPSSYRGDGFLIRCIAG